MLRALVLGGYGLIGSACMRALSHAGFSVSGLGRSASSARMADPDADWIIRNIPSITVADWQGILQGVDVVVNASGALQDGARDDLEAIHVTTLDRLTEAAAGLPLRIIQISAAGVSPDAATEFLRSKARGEALLQAGLTDWVILRPALVLAPDAYGGTALLRAAASLPLIQPRMMPQAHIQTVHVYDVAAAVVAAATWQMPAGAIFDLAEAQSHNFPDLVDAVRRWQGHPPPRWRPAMPDAELRLIGRGADLLGHLGWRSPLRSNALTTLRDGIIADPSAWLAAGGRPCRSLTETLAQIPATRQERLFARAYLALPLAIATLAIFWTLSGLITLMNPARAMTVLSDRAVPPGLTGLTVIGGALVDLFLGLVILWRPWAKRAALGMIVLSAAYLAGSLIVAPDLWADPLGPMVKVLPGITLAAIVWLLLEDR